MSVMFFDVGQLAEIVLLAANGALHGHMFDALCEDAAVASKGNAAAYAERYRESFEGHPQWLIAESARALAATRAKSGRPIPLSQTMRDAALLGYNVDDSKADAAAARLATSVLHAAADRFDRPLGRGLDGDEDAAVLRRGGR